MTKSSTSEQKPEKKKSAGTAVLIVLIVLSIIGATALGVGIKYAKKFRYNHNDISTENLGATETVDSKTINIALFGVDTRNEESFDGRSDSIMILSINTGTKKIKLISVLRDSLVPIEKDSGIQYNKINNAYASGGPELAIKTLNTIFALDITEYATVNFDGMENIIDAIGGIEVTVTEDELTTLNAHLNSEAEKYGGNKEDYRISSGKQTLNGIKAVLYSRIRYISNAEGTSNDYGRTDRQRLVLEQIMLKATKMNKTRYIELISALAPCIETSLSYTEVLNLASKVLLDSPTFEEGRVPSVEYTMTAPKTSAGSVVYYDLEFAANIIHSFIYEDITPEKYIEINGISKNDWYSVGYKPPVIKNKGNTLENVSSE